MTYPYKRTVKIPGTNVDMVLASDEVCETAEFVLCLLAGEGEPGNIPQMESYCIDCGKKVLRDARGPKKPPSICVHCLIKRNPDQQTVSE